MNKKISPLRLFVIATLGMSLCSMIPIGLSYATAYDNHIGYFSTGTPLPTVALLLPLFFVFGAVGINLWLLRTQKDAFCLTDPLWFRIISAVVGIALLAVTVTDLLAAAPLLTVLVGAIGGIHFLLRAFKCPSLSLTLTGIAVIARLAIAIGPIYFNWEIPMNAPVKILLQLGIVAAMYFLLQDLKISLSPSRSFITLFSIGLGSLLTGIASLPTLIAYFRGDLGEIDVLSTSLLLLFLWVYCTCRIPTLAVSPDVASPADADLPPEDESTTPSEDNTTDPS